MADIKAIIEALDKYIIKEGKTHIAPPEANQWLERNGLLNDNDQRPGLPLRNLLRAGKLPHAYQERGKHSKWMIPHSDSNPLPFSS